MLKREIERMKRRGGRRSNNKVFWVSGLETKRKKQKAGGKRHRGHMLDTWVLSAHRRASWVWERVGKLGRSGPREWVMVQEDNPIGKGGGVLRKRGGMQIGLNVGLKVG